MEGAVPDYTQKHAQTPAWDGKRNGIYLRCDSMTPTLRSSLISSFLSGQIGLSTVVTIPLLRYRLCYLYKHAHLRVDFSLPLFFFFSSSYYSCWLTLSAKSNNKLRLQYHAHPPFYKHSVYTLAVILKSLCSQARRPFLKPFVYTLAVALEPLSSHACCPSTSTLFARSPSVLQPLCSHARRLFYINSVHTLGAVLQTLC